VKGIFPIQTLPGVNFTNVLRAAFARTNPKSAKRNWRLDCFALLGSANKQVGEIDPWTIKIWILTTTKIVPEGVHPKSNTSKENGLICEDGTTVDDWMEHFGIVFSEYALPNS
jgi:hypothetical protein